MTLLGRSELPLHHQARSLLLQRPLRRKRPRAVLVEPQLPRRRRSGA